MANLLDECDVGNSIACLALSTEEEAKRAWLSKLEVSSWGKVAEAVKEVAEGVADRNGTPLVIPKTRSKKKAERAKAEEAKAEVKSVKGVPWPRSTDGAPGGEFCAQGTRPTRKRMRLNARRERVEARLEARRAARAAKDAVMIEAFFEQKRRDASSGSANNAVADPSPVVADESSSASAIADASSASAAVADASSSSYRVFDQVFQVWTDVGEIGVEATAVAKSRRLLTSRRWSSAATSTSWRWRCLAATIPTRSLRTRHSPRRRRARSG